MLRKTWFQGMVRRLTKSSPTTTRKRPAFSPPKLELLEDRTTPTTLAWTGATSTDWAVAGNWSPNGVPASGDTLTFDTGTAGLTSFTSNNTIAGLSGLIINVHDTNASSDFTITGVDTGIASLTNVQPNGPGATTLGIQLHGTGASLTATSGVLTLANTYNVFDAASQLHVPVGGTANVSTFPTSTFGQGTLDITGGTLNLQNAPLAVNAGMYEYTVTDGADSTTPVDPISTPATNTNVPSAGAGYTQNNGTVDGIQYWTQDNETFVYTGQFFTADGHISFAENVDDNVRLSVDGVEVLHDTQWNVPTTTNDLFTNTALNGGVGLRGGWHDFDFRFGNGGGGAGPVADGTGWSAEKGFGFKTSGNFASTAGSDYSIFQDTTTQFIREYDAGITLPPTVFNSLSVSGSSTVNLDGTLTATAAQVTSLTMASGATLNLNAPGGQILAVTGSTSLAGPAILNTVGTAGLRLGGQVSGAGGFTKNGLGTVYLDSSANNYTGANVVNLGVVVLDADNTLGATSSGTTVNAGGQIKLNANYNAAEPLTISGGSLTVNPGFAGNYYRSTGMNHQSIDPQAGDPNVGGPLNIDLTTLVGTTQTPRVDFGGYDTVNGVTYDTTTPPGYAQIAGTGAVPLDRSGASGYPSYNAFAGVGIDPGSNDNIGGVWTGNLNIKVAGTYRFFTRSDDGSRMWIDNALVVENDFDQGMTNRSGDVALTVGIHTIQVAYYEGGGGWGMQAFWQRVGDPSFPRHVINDTIYDGGDAVATSTTFGSPAPLTTAGNFNFNGPITLAGDAVIKSSGTLTLNGGVATNGHQLTSAGGGTLTVATVGVTGTGSLRGIAGGTINLNAANGFTGGTNILDGGIVQFTVDSGTGPIHVFNNGSLIYTGATDLTFTTSSITLDNGANIVSRNAKFIVPTATLPLNGTLIINNDNVNDNLVVFPNALALTQNFNVQVGGGLGNGGAGVFAGVISGGFGFNKSGPGVLVLDNNNNTFTGTNTVLAGVLAAGAPNAFGSTAGGTVVSLGASLGLAADPTGFGDFTLNPAEPLTIAGGAGAGGIGAIVNLQGNNTFSTVLAPFGIATSIGSVSGNFTFASNLGKGGGLTFSGAGNINVTGNIADAPATVVPYGFVGFTGATGGAQSTQDILNWTYSGATNINYGTGFASNTLQLNGGAAINGSNSLELTDNLGGEARSAFQAVTPSAFTSHFQFQISGDQAADGFTFTAQNAGLTALGGGGGQLGYTGINSSLSVQFNMYQNISTMGFGLNGQDTASTKIQVDLAAHGFNFHDPAQDVFDVTVVYNGSNAGSVRIFDATANPTGLNPFVQPFDFNPPNTVTKMGTGTTTLSGNNTYTAPTIVQAGTLAVASAASIGGTSSVVVQGGSFALTGATFDISKPITLNGPGAGSLGGALVNLDGTHSTSGPAIVLGSAASIGSASGTLTVNNGVNEVFYPLTASGAGNTVFNGVITSNDRSPAAGLLVGQTNNAADFGVTTVPNPAFGSDVDSLVTMAEKTGGDGAVLQTNLKTWATNDTWFYEGQVFFPNSNGDGTGTIFFADQVDDDALLRIDGVQYINDTNWQTPDASGPVTLPTGWHNIDLRFSNGGGGAGASADGGIGAVGWSTSKGFGYHISTGPSDPMLPANGGGTTLGPATSDPTNWQDGANYALPDGTTPQFRYIPVNNAGFFKTGTGAATLAAANTYYGNTTVSNGTLNTTISNALGFENTTSTLKVTGATTVVNLFNDAAAETKVGTANFDHAVGSVVNTGLGKLHVANTMTLLSSYTITGDFTAHGSNLADNSVQRDLAAVTGALTVTHPADSLTVSMVDAPIPIVQLATLAPTVATTPFTVTGGNVLVVDLGLRADQGSNVGFHVTWDNGAGGGPVQLTLAARATYAPGSPDAVSGAPLFSRDSSIWYLYNPLPGAGTLSVEAPDGNTGPESWITAFTLANVNTASAPITGTSTSVTDIAPPTTVTGVAQGSWMSVAEGNFPLGTTTTWVSPGAGPVTNYQFFNTASNMSFNTGLFQNVSQGLPTDDYTVTGTLTSGPAPSRDNRTVAAFAPSPGPNSTINLPATNISLPAGTSLHLNVNSSATLGNIALLAAGTTVAGGTSTPTSLTVNNLSGLGTVSLPVTVGGETSPGLSPGILNTAAGVGLKTGGSLKIEINGTTAGTQYDQLNVTGAVTLNAGGGTGATLNVILGSFTPTTGQTFTIVKGSGSTIAGNFNGLAENSTFTVGSSTFRINYNVGATKDIVLTAQAGVVTPPPTLVGSPVVNGGAAYAAFAGPQRSDVVSMQLTFNEPVTLAAGALAMAVHTNNQGLGAIPSFVQTTPDGGTTWIITFAGPNTDPTFTDPTGALFGTGAPANGFRSLADGVYDFSVNLANVHPVADGTVSGVGTSTSVVHRLFGDADTTGEASGVNHTATVNTADNLLFRAAFNTPANYVPYFDFDGNGQINTADNLQFRNRFNRPLSWTE